MNAATQAMHGLGSMRIVTFSIVAVVLLIVFGFLSVRLTSPVLSPLYTNLSADDSSIIVTELGSLGVKFEIGSGGNQVMVESSEILRVRMLLAEKGLPNGGSIVGYEIFDKDSALGTSNFVHNVNLLRALEGELGRTIASLSSVKSARVHLVIPKKELFKKSRIEPSASVVLTLNNQIEVARNEANAVKHLVSSAVSGLKPSRITIIDSKGKVLSRGVSDEDDGGVSSADSADYRSGMEHRMKRTIENLLEQAVGIGRVQAQVSIEIAFDRITESSEIYDPDGQVVRSVQISEKKEMSSENVDGNAVGAAPKLSGKDEGGAFGSSNSNEKTDEVTNFEISKKVINKISEVGAVKRISVAVLVDGTYQTKIDEEEETEEEIYSPRTDEELQQLKTLVKSAIGFNKARGDSVELINMQFTRDIANFMADEGAFDWLKRDLDSILKTIVVGIVAILAIMLVIRPLVNRAFEISPADLEADNIQAQAAGIGGSAMIEPQFTGSGDPFSGENDDIDLDMIQNKVDKAPAKKVNELIENNPEETLAVIRTWLTEGS